ncbi:MAG: ribose-phosphate diphosphokinase [Clostridia bacterium]
MHSFKIFAGCTGRNFAEEICRHLGVELGRSSGFCFSEGNTYVKIEETVRNMDIYLVQSIAMRPNDEFTEILFWIDAFKRASARSVTVILPYFGYAKGDKKDEARVSIRARVCADCMEVTGADRVVTMDLHSPQIQGFFKIPVDNLLAISSLCEHIGTISTGDMVVVSPDSGYARTARMYGKYLNRPIAIGDKVRTSHDETAIIMDIIGEVKGKDALIVDDFTNSGGTLVDLACKLKDRGVKRIYCALSHILLNEAGVARIEASPIELLVSTDTVDNPYVGKSGKIKIVSVTSLFAKVIQCIENNESVSSLFEIYNQ